MRYIDKYPECNGCPVEKYCGTTISSMKLCNSYKEEPMKENKKDLMVVINCVRCFKETSVEVNRKDYFAWKKDTYAQVAFPYLTHVERDILITHICPECQAVIDAHFKEE